MREREEREREREREREYSFKENKTILSEYKLES